MTQSFDINVHVVGLEWKNADLDVTDRPKGVHSWQINLFHDAVLVGPTKQQAKDTGGPAVAFFPPHASQWFKASGVGYTDDWCGCRGEVDKALKYYGLPVSQGLPITNISELERCMRSMHREWKDRPLFSNEAMTSHLIEFIRLTARGLDDSQGTERHYDAIMVLRREMREASEKDWSVPEMAERVGLSENRFSYLYKRYCGEAPQRDLIGFRMQRAVGMVVEHREISISDIAEICGYQDQMYFSRVFKRYFGRTPSSYRED